MLPGCRAPCHVVYTDYRPVPLQHYIFPDGSEGIHMVVDERGKFREDNFQKAIAALADTSAAASAASGKGGKRQKGKGTQQGEESNIFKLVKMCMLRDFDPVRLTGSSVPLSSSVCWLLILKDCLQGTAKPVKSGLMSS